MIHVFQLNVPLAAMALAGRSCSDENRCVLVGLTSCHYGAWSPLLA